MPEISINRSNRPAETGISEAPGIAPGVERRSIPGPVVTEVPADRPATICAVDKLVLRFGGRGSPAILKGVSLDIADGEAAFDAARGNDRATGLGRKVMSAIHEKRGYGVLAGAYNGFGQSIPRNLKKRGLARRGRSANRRARFDRGQVPASAPDNAERWQRGRMRRTRNAVYGQPYRGFESHPLRHRISPNSSSAT